MRAIGLTALALGLFLPSSGRAQVPPSSRPRVEIAANVGGASVMSDESWRGGGLTFGGTVSARILPRLTVSFDTERLESQRDFSSNVHWKDSMTLFTGGVGYRFRTARVQPFVEYVIGAARVHTVSRYPTYVWLPGPPGLIPGPDQLFDAITTRRASGFGTGAAIYFGRALAITPDLRLVGLAGADRVVTRAALRVGYGWGSLAMPAPAAGRATSPPRTRPARPARSFSELPAYLAVGDIVQVADRDLQQTKGIVAGLSPSSLTILVDGKTVEMNEPDVVGIDRRGDSVTNGVWTGFAIGAVTPLAIIFSMCQDGCSRGSDQAAAAMYSAVFGALGGGIGAAAGYLIDAARAGRTRVFEAPGSMTSPRIAIVPEARAGLKAVHVVIAR